MSELDKGIRRRATSESRPRGRVRVDVDASCKIASSRGPALGRVRDVSDQGIRLFTPNSYGVGDKLTLTILLPGFANRFEFKAEVRRVDMAGTGDLFEIGARFIHTAASQKLLKNLLWEHHLGNVPDLERKPGRAGDPKGTAKTPQRPAAKPSMIAKEEPALTRRAMNRLFASWSKADDASASPSLKAALVEPGRVADVPDPGDVTAPPDVAGEREKAMLDRAERLVQEVKPLYLAVMAGTESGVTGKEAVDVLLDTVAKARRKLKESRHLYLTVKLVARDTVEIEGCLKKIDRFLETMAAYAKRIKSHG